jgi:hypothetical protein
MFKGAKNLAYFNTNQRGVAAFPLTVKSIGASAFEGVEQINHIIFSNDLEKIDRRFLGPTGNLNVRHFTFPNPNPSPQLLQQISENFVQAFGSASEDVYIHVPYSVDYGTAIDKSPYRNAFRGNSKFKLSFIRAKKFNLVN